MHKNVLNEKPPNSKPTIEFSVHVPDNEPNNGSHFFVPGHLMTGIRLWLSLDQRCTTFLGQGRSVLFSVHSRAEHKPNTKLLAELSRVVYKKPNLIQFY